MLMINYHSAPPPPLKYCTVTHFIHSDAFIKKHRSAPRCVRALKIRKKSNLDSQIFRTVIHDSSITHVLLCHVHAEEYTFTGQDVVLLRMRSFAPKMVE